MKRNLLVLAVAVLGASFIAGCSGGDAPSGSGSASGQIDTKQKISRPKPSAGGGGLPANAQPQ